MTLTRINYALPTIPQPDRLGLLLAYDEDREEIWGYGGFDLTTFAAFGELWRWRLAEPEKGWVRVPVLGPRPTARSDAIWVWDSLRRNFLLAGGVDTAFTFLTDTWRFDPGALSWTDIGTTGLAGRFPQTGVYDKARDRVVRFGGWDTGFLPQQDTQLFDPDGKTWTTPSFSLALPLVRAGHGMAYDELRQLTIVFGGTTTAAVEIGDTWAYPVAGEWAEQLSTISPSPRRLMIMAYHPRLRGVVVSHGSFNGPIPGDGFLLTADGYRELHPTAPPDERDIVYAARADALGGVAMHGGLDQINPPFPVLVETWILDRLEEWSEPAIGLDYDRTEIDITGGGAVLADPSSVASSTIERRAPTALGSIASWVLAATVPANSRLLVALVLDGAYLYWDGDAWVASDLTEGQRNTPAEVAANIGALTLVAGGSQLSENLLLISDNAIATPEVFQLEIDGDLAFIAGAAPRLVTIRGLIDDEGGAVVPGAKLTITPPDGGYYHEGRLIARSFSASSDVNGEILVQAYETESVGVEMTIKLDLGTGTRTATAVIPDRSPIELKELLP